MNKFRAYWLFLIAAIALSLSAGALAETPKSSADAKEVTGYTKKDGTKVKGYTRKKKEEKADAAKTEAKTEAKAETKTEAKAEKKEAKAESKKEAAAAEKKDDNLVHVKGYTKKDGTKVEGYTRRKHADK